jgi:hypothetical protein
VYTSVLLEKILLFSSSFPGEARPKPRQVEA